VLTTPLPEFRLSTALVALGVGFLGGLIPDLDTPTSNFWQKFPAGTFLGRLFHPFLGGHRVISHSIIGLIILGFTAKYVLSLVNGTLLVNMEIVWWALMIGAVSHLIMDTFTHEGVPWLFPVPLHIGIPPLKMLRIKTGGAMEKWVVFPLLLIFNGYLFYSFYPNYLQLLKSLIR
jgi:inner membrane protein